MQLPWKILRWFRGAVLGALLLVALAFLAFGPRPSAAVPKDRVVVEYWEKWTGREADAMRVIVDDFNSTVGREKGIYVRFLSISNIEQKTMTACAAGVPPDIAGLFQRSMFQFADLDALLPLDEMAKEYGIDEQTYKPVFWKAAHYDGHLWCLLSTPAIVALHYHKSVFAENADRLRAAGLDPTRPPRTIQELDQYAAVMDERDANGRLRRLGFLPMEPNWYLDYMFYWFGGSPYDERTGKFTLTSPQCVATYQWIKNYSTRLGRNAITDYRDSVGQQFASAQNPFMTTPPRITMELQGPWLASFIYNLTRKQPWAPSISEELTPREKEFSLPNRQDNYEWAAAPFPSAVPGLENVTFADYDAFCIPRGARHVKEAFEFMAYVNQQAVMEKLCSRHCKSSPLQKVSEAFIRNHPNPYIQVFEDLSRSPNARGAPQVPIWAQAHKELGDAVQSVYLLHAEPADALATAQTHLQEKLDRSRANREARRIH